MVAQHDLAAATDGDDGVLEVLGQPLSRECLLGVRFLVVCQPDPLDHLEAMPLCKLGYLRPAIARAVRHDAPHAARRCK